MRRYLKTWLRTAALAVLLMGGIFLSGAEARTVVVGGNPYAGGPYYGNPYYYGPQPVVVEPLFLPRTGSNDYLYQYDNIYGSGASAAGRMSHTVVNPQPQIFYPRQPRVYLGY